jgi:NADH-quinone oxidoreductase subunit J
MALTAGFFYLFAVLAVVAAVMVIVAKNPVHAVLYLILAFFNAAGLFVLLGAEFRGFGIGTAHAPGAAAAAGVSNTQALGLVLYTRYVYYFEVAGLILLVAMIGAIVLTLSHKPGVRRQSIAAQVARTPATGVEIVSVPVGGAIFPADGQG